MTQKRTKRQHRIKKRARVRAVLSGSASRPRLAVFRSAKYIYAQLIDDTTGKTLAAVSGEVMANKKGNKVIASGMVGKQLAEKALALGIKKIAFDRGGYKYHGRVKAVAEAARSSGLAF